MLHQIGVGALGPVFRTYEPTRDRLVAVKVFRLDVTPEQARALADELGRAADAGLFHPSIVEPVAAGLEGTVAYRAEEYVAAESLDVAMRHYAPATLDKALPFITQLASAIDFARAAGVGHGALHPRDIFVTPDEARATGFGVVDAMERLGLRAPVRRPYSPPERIAGQAWSTPADVFSLAAIAFELLTGRRPSGVGDNMGSLSGATLGDRVGEIRGVLARAMDEQPAERFQTAQAFSAALAAAAGLVETPVSVAPRQVEAAITTQPDIVSAPPEPVEPAFEMPLTAGAPPTTADVELALKDTGRSADAEPLPARSDDERALDDFAGDPNPVSAFDSPREAARKAVAARRRQPKKKVETALFEPPREEPAAPVSTAEAMASLPEAMPIPLTPDPSSEVVEPVEEAVNTETRAPVAAEDEPEREEAVEEFKPLYPAAIVSTDEDIDLIAASDVPELTQLEAVEIEHSGRDRSDRVVAVDEFRAREATKPERTWPRVSERASQERPQFERSDRGQSPGPNSPLSSNLSLGSTSEQEAAVAADSGSRQRVMMLPLALVAGLCLIVGYGIGYFVRGQDVVNNPTGPTATSTTGLSPKSEAVAPPAEAPSPAPEGTLGSKPPSTNPPPPSASKPAPVASASKSSSVAMPKTGHLVVNSTPEKAAVTVNGKWSGRTPLTLSDLKFGKYVIRVVEPGYEVGQQQFTLSANSASRTVDVTLKRKPEARRSSAAPAKSSAAAPKPTAAAETATATAKATAAKTPATIYVDSRPQGARVFLDNKEMGVTPVTLTDQVPGSRVVRLELPDHSPRSETIVVKPGVTTRVTRSLERIR